MVLASCGEPETVGNGTPPRPVTLAAVDFAFEAEEAITISAGDTIDFTVVNEGNSDHQMEVLTDESRRLGMTERLSPGDSDTVRVTFEEPGVYVVICDIDDHRSLGQVARFTVEL